MATIVVTGAGSGIGRATARAFLAAGWTVGLMGRRVIHNGDLPNCADYETIDDIVNIINYEASCRSYEDVRFISGQVRAYLEIGTKWLNTEYYE